MLTAAVLLLTLFTAGCSNNTDTPDNADNTEVKESGDVIDLSQGGILFTVPQEYVDAKGVLYQEADALEGKDDIFYSAIIYIAMELEEYERIMSSDNISDEDLDRYFDAYRQPAIIVCAADELGVEEIADALLEAGATDMEADTLEKFGTNEGYDYYLWLDKDTSQDAALGDFAAEYRALCDRELTISCVKFVKPVKETFDASKGRLSFETTDVNGNKVTSEELFAANKVTMVNIWASWCGPCVNEMPELEELNREFAGMDCGIIGILADAYEDTGLEDGKDVIKDTGVTYPVILPWDSFGNDLYYNAYPTTYFVDSEGNILDVEPVVGAYVSKYKQVIEEALKKVS